MEMISMLAIVLLVAMIPIILFIGIIAMALLIWCWARIGRYFVNLATWVGDWRNFVPLTVLGTVLMVVVVVLLYLLPQLRLVWIVLLILQLVITIVCIIFAAIAWMFWFYAWFWPRYRRRLWSVIFKLFEQRPVGQKTRPVVSRGRPKPVAGPTPATEPGAERRPPQKRSMLGSFWNLMLGKPARPARPVAPFQADGAGVRPAAEAAPAKRSFLGTFWAMMLGKPQPKRRQPRPKSVQTMEQTLGPSVGAAATGRTESSIGETAPSTVPRAEKRTPPKRSWFSTFWSLMLGKPSKSGRPRPRPVRVKAAEQPPRPPETAAAAAMKTGATARVTEAATTPQRAKKEKPAKRGFFAGIWTSIVRGVTFVVGLVFLGVVWVVQKMREGIEWVRVRLNLD